MRRQRHEIIVTVTEEFIAAMAKSISGEFPHTLRELRNIIRRKLINRELTQEELEQEIRDITDELYDLPEEGDNDDDERE